MDAQYQEQELEVKQVQVKSKVPTVLCLTIQHMAQVRNKIN